MRNTSGLVEVKMHSAILFSNILLTTFTTQANLTRMTRAIEPVQFEPNIIGGDRVTNPEEFPFISRIISKDNGGNELICGGTILSPNEILTAAHCFFDKVTGIRNEELKYQIIAGCLYPLTPASEIGLDANCQMIDVLRVEVHQEFNPITMENDIALLTLALDLKVDNRTVKAIPILESDLAKEGNMSTLIGWGCTSNEECNDIKYLYKVDVSILQNQQCALQGRQVSDKQLCTNGDSKGACKGDSGGPLLCMVKGAYHLCGVVSYGSLNCSQNKPDVYTNPGAYLKWIRNDGNPGRKNPGIVVGIVVVFVIWLLIGIIFIVVKFTEIPSWFNGTICTYVRNCRVSDTHQRMENVEMVD